MGDSIIPVGPHPVRDGRITTRKRGRWLWSAEFSYGLISVCKGTTGVPWEWWALSEEAVIAKVRRYADKLARERDARASIHVLDAERG